ncbi:hypothetical protein BJV74DRAFT_810804 [Russula compacta]|nr:hypothetical protein BJV74DRAFT_810804 [Russula compacta]
MPYTALEVNKRHPIASATSFQPSPHPVGSADPTQSMAAVPVPSSSRPRWSPSRLPVLSLFASRFVLYFSPSLLIHSVNAVRHRVPRTLNDPAQRSSVPVPLQLPSDSSLRNPLFLSKSKSPRPLSLLFLQAITALLKSSSRAHQPHLSFAPI